MVAGSRSASGSRQNGRYSEEKDKKSNRKPNRKTKKDQIEMDLEAKSAELGLHSNKHDIPIPVKNKLTPTILKERTTEDPHDKVMNDRPNPIPDWFSQQLAFTPSKSYIDESKDAIKK